MLYGAATYHSYNPIKIMNFLLVCCEKQLLKKDNKVAQ